MRRKRVNLILVLLGLLIFPVIVSANGLTIIGDKNFIVNKTAEQIETIDITLKNEETFDFFNITVEDNSHLEMDLINVLHSGESINVTLDVVGDENFNGPIRIKGFFESTLAELNEFHIVNVSFNDGIDLCNLVVTKGDTVSWVNLIDSASGSIDMFNSDTGIKFATIPSLGNYTEFFSTPKTLNYFFSRLGFPFTETCSVDVLDTQGLVNNPDLDDIINLNLQIEFKETNLKLTILSNNFSIEAGESSDDILKIENVGSEVARNIHFSGEWFTFFLNDFDLVSGQSRNVGFTIIPIINSTNSTNKTYVQQISITGNFETLTHNINVFVPHKDVGEGGIQSSQTLEALVKGYADIIVAFCNEKPNEKICDILQSSSSSALSSVQNNDTLSQSQFLDFVKGFIEFIDRQDVQNNFQKERLDLFEQKLIFIESSSNLTFQISQEALNNSEENSSTLFLNSFTFASTIMVGFLLYWAVLKKRKNKFEEIFKYK